MLFLWHGVGWKCHYAHGLIELLRWPPAAGVDFHPTGCRCGGSVSSLSSDLRAEKVKGKKLCLSCRYWSIYRTKAGLFVALCSSPAGYEMRCATQGESVLNCQCVHRVDAVSPKVGEQATCIRLRLKCSFFSTSVSIVKLHSQPQHNMQWRKVCRSDAALLSS